MEMNAVDFLGYIVVTVHMNLDFKFWALLPAININRHMRELEFEWLCLGFYISCRYERQ